MKTNQIQIWINKFLRINDSIRKKNNNNNSSAIINSSKNLKINSQTVSIWQNLIFEIVKKIGKDSRDDYVFKFSSKINQHDIIKSFIHHKFLGNCIWIFKYRKNFPVFLNKKKNKKKKKQII